jgi:hypothetical protein
MAYALVHYPAIDELYTGLLTSYNRKDIAYVPHVTLGSFAGRAQQCAEALRETEGLPLQYRSVVDRLHLVKLIDDRQRIVFSKEVLFRKQCFPLPPAINKFSRARRQQFLCTIPVRRLKATLGAG